MQDQIVERAKLATNCELHCGIFNFQEGTVDQNYSMDENDKTTWGFTSEWTSSTNILGLVVFRCLMLNLFAKCQR